MPELPSPTCARRARTKYSRQCVSTAVRHPACILLRGNDNGLTHTLSVSTARKPARRRRSCLKAEKQAHHGGTSTAACTSSNWLIMNVVLISQVGSGIPSQIFPILTFGPIEVKTKAKKRPIVRHRLSWLDGPRARRLPAARPRADLLTSRPFGVAQALSSAGPDTRDAYLSTRMSALGDYPSGPGWFRVRTASGTDFSFCPIVDGEYNTLSGTIGGCDHVSRNVRRPGKIRTTGKAATNRSGCSVPIVGRVAERQTLGI